MSSATPQRQLEEAASFLSNKMALRPKIGLVLGSGLGGLAEEVSTPEVVDFGEIPHLPRAGVAGHRGSLVLGKLSGQAVALLCGRLHHYEGHSMWQVTFPMRLLHALGVRILVVTNAAGALNPHFHPGDLMLIADHINLPGLAGMNPLHGLDQAEFSPRFVSMAQAYDPALHKLAWAVGAKLKLAMHSGTYVMVAGPSYETPAELRFLQAIGADAVGMSTVPEVIVAVQLQMRVLGISGITNQATSSGHEAVTHEQVLRQGKAIEPRMGALIKGVIEALPEYLQ